MIAWSIVGLDRCDICKVKLPKNNAAGRCLECRAQFCVECMAKTKECPVCVKDGVLNRKIKSDE